MIPNGGRLCNFENMESSLHHIRQSLEQNTWLSHVCLGKAEHYIFTLIVEERNQLGIPPRIIKQKETVTAEMVVKAIITTLGPRMKAAGVK